MAIDAINDDSLREALRALRRNKPLADNPLLSLDAVEARRRSEGLDDTVAARSWALGQTLSRVTYVELERLRGDTVRDVLAEDTPERHLARIDDDFAAGSPDREALSILYTRYFALPDRTIRELAPRVNTTPRTLRRRIARGREVLAEAMRQLEIEAHRRGPEVPPDQAGSELEEPLDTASASPTTTRPDPTASPPDPTAAAAWLRAMTRWTDASHRIADRFVQLTLLVDRGEDARGARWDARDESFEDVSDVLAAVDEPAVVVLGAPGAGKTTLLQRYEFDQATRGLRGESAPVTLFASLARYRVAAGAEGAPAEWLAAQWRRANPESLPLEEVMAAYPVVLLLDGLNEMPHDSPVAYRRRVAEWKAFLLDRVVGTAHRALLSCRSLDYSAPLSTPELRVPQARIEPMSDAQVQSFLKRYAPRSAAAVWDRLQDSGQLELMRHPYFMRLLAEHADETGDVPAGRAALFTGLVRRAIRREIERENPLFLPGEIVTDRDCLRLLRNRMWRSAYELPSGGSLIVGLSDLAMHMQGESAAGRGLSVRLAYEESAHLVRDHGGDRLLRAGHALSVLDEDLEQDEVRFFHHLLQEYFAARRLAEDVDPTRVAMPWRSADIDPELAEAVAELSPSEPLPSLATSGWEESTILAVAMSESPDEAVRRLSKAEPAIAGAAAAQPEVWRHLRASTIHALRAALVERSSDPEADLRARIAAGRALGRIGDPRLERREGADGDYLLPPLIALEGGRYPMGAVLDYAPGSAPEHEVELAPFHLTARPVTNAEFRCFVEAGGYHDARWWDDPHGRAWLEGEGTAHGARARMVDAWRMLRDDPSILEQERELGRVNDEQYAGWRKRIAMDEDVLRDHLASRHPQIRATEPAFWDDRRYNNGAQPVLGISWYEARAYCRWLSAQSGLPFRLPTEVEWEAAARGSEGRTYAYGNDFDPWCANTVETRVQTTTPVGVFVEGRTPEGIADLTGNLSEWTTSAFGQDGRTPHFGYPYDPDDGREDPQLGYEVRRVVRGGSWYADGLYARPAVRIAYHPGDRLDSVGMRLAVSLPLASTIPLG